MKLIRSGEAAKILGVTSQTAARWGKEGIIPCHLTEGGQVKFDPREVEKHKKKMESKASQKKAKEESKKLRKKRPELSPLQVKLRDQMKRPLYSRISGCLREGDEEPTDDSEEGLGKIHKNPEDYPILRDFDAEEIESVVSNRKVQWAIFVYGRLLKEEALVSPRELHVDMEKRTISFREKDARKFRAIYIDRVFGGR